MKTLIVSRHPAAIAFIRREAPEFSVAPVVAQATAEDVRGAVVAGNLPLHLAALAAQVVAVEFGGDPPRGQEYDLAAMDAAGARLRRYTVQVVATPVREMVFADGRKSRGYYDRLLVGRGDAIHEFVGQTIPGVVAVVQRDDAKMGKWSQSTYRLRFAPGAWDLVSSQDWETGERLHTCHSVTELVAEFRRAGCTAPAEAIVAAVSSTLSDTLSRIERQEAELASVED